MGEARRRGTRAERKEAAHGKGVWKQRFDWLLGIADTKAKAPRIPKRERAKRRRAVKRALGLGRRELGRLGSLPKSERGEEYNLALLLAGL